MTDLIVANSQLGQLIACAQGIANICQLIVANRKLRQGCARG